MTDIFPPRPASVPADFTAPSLHYRLHAWLTAFALTAFMLAYLALTLWFGRTAWQLFTARPAGNDGVASLIGGLLALILTLFMLKGLFFFRRGKLHQAIELLPADQPRLFAFLHQLADEAGAPRPHRVFVSPEVNACVFYDLSVLNLIFPSRKNLIIGLGLVNALSLSELKAVCAHEFGHFAQRSMAVGRWVYVAEQIVFELIYRRDWFDHLIDNAADHDPRLAWLSLLAALPIWAMRALLEATMSLVMLAERALSREMEFQADRVAVSLTGSDAILAALHRLRPADEAWERSINFFNALLARNLAPADVFTLQTRILEHLRQLLRAPDFGLTPRQAGRPAERIFALALAKPPRMWSTHPLNHEREDRARAHYLPCQLAPGDAWVLFSQPERLRRELTGKMYNAQDVTILDDTGCLAELNRYLACTPILAGLNASGRRDTETAQESLATLPHANFYLGRPLTRHTADPARLYTPLGDFADPATLYPAELAQAATQLAALETEADKLRELLQLRKHRPASIPFRCKALPASEWPAALAALAAESKQLQQRLQAHDQRCRNHFRALARQHSGEWPAAWGSRLALLHYAEHSAANLQDLRRHLHELIALITASARVDEHDLDSALQAASQLYSALTQLYGQREQLELPAEVLDRHAFKNWPAQLGSLDISMPSRQNINDWAGIIDNWVDHAIRALEALQQIALHALLECEDQLAAAHAGRPLPAAPERLLVPQDYPRLISGEERRHQPAKKRFTALRKLFSFTPAVLRYALALCIILALGWLKSSFTSSTIQVHNGLDRTVTVSTGSEQITLAPFASAPFQVSVGKGEALHLRSQTDSGELIEALDVRLELNSSDYIYNLAAAAPIVKWYQGYGSASAPPDELLGNTTWQVLPQHVDAPFTAPPEQITTSAQTDGGIRSVLYAPEEHAGIDAHLNLMPAARPESLKQMIQAHARWDRADAPLLAHWLQLAHQQQLAAEILAARLRAEPAQVVLARAEQDIATKPEAHQRVCAAQAERARTLPASGDQAYLAARCQRSPAAYLSALQQWPDNPWLNHAVGVQKAENGEWRLALQHWRKSLAHPFLAEINALEMARVLRLRDGPGTSLGELAAHSGALLRYLKAEQASDPALQALSRGEPALAAELAGDDPANAWLLRLTAASDDAPDAIIRRALALPLDTGMNANTLASSLALALRHKHPSANSLRGKLAEIYGQDIAGVYLSFIDQLAAGQPEAAEQALTGFNIETRARALSMGNILLGWKAPAHWRQQASRLLFAVERPWFHTDS